MFETFKRVINDDVKSLFINQSTTLFIFDFDILDVKRVYAFIRLFINT